MSPVSLSAPSSSPVFQAKQTRQLVRFGSGNGEPPKDADAPAETEQKDKVNLSESQEAPSSEGVKAEKSGEQKAAEQAKKEEPPKPGIFSRLKTRFGQFFHYLGKAFTKLFGPNKPKTGLEKELRQYKHDMKPENLRAFLKARAEYIQKNGSQKAKERHAQLLEAAKTEEGLQAYTEESLKLATASVWGLNQIRAASADVFEDKGQEPKDTQVETESKEKSKNN